MAKQIQLRRGTTSQQSSFTGAVGEVTIDTDKDEIRIHDGSTAGGIAIPGYTLRQDLLNGQSDGVGNIGSSGTGFNTLHAKATSAQYADLAEKYRGDKKYPAGTVVAIGGKKEITQTQLLNDPTQIGVISTNPAYKMNDKIKGQYVAFTGRVPVRVVGKVKRGDMVISSNVAGCATGLGDNEYVPGAVIGKSLQEFTGNGEGSIEVIIGRY